MLLIIAVASLLLLALSSSSSSVVTAQTLNSPRPAGYYTTARMLELRDKVTEHFRHAYDGYMQYAFPMDELKPLSCKGTDHFGRYSMTAIDTLDTLALMGDYKEFFFLVDHIDENVHFNGDMSISVFETTIRVLGGLTASHDIAVRLAKAVEEVTVSKKDSHGYDADTVKSLLSVVEAARRYNGALLRKAVSMADKLVAAFDTPTGIPFNEVNLLRGMPDPAKGHATCPAAAGSLILEFGYLSHLSGNCTYLQLARQAFASLWKHRSPHNMVGTMIDIYSGFWINTEANIGASVDSFYEYMVKAYIASGGDKLYLDMWEQASRSIYKHTFFSGWYLSSSVEFKGPLENFEHRFNSLQTFWPGLQALAGDVQGAVYSFEKTHCICRSLHFPPEYLHVGEYVTANPNPRKGGPGYPLRPEVIESAYYLHRSTMDDYFLNVGEHFMTHLQRARTRCGFAAILNVWDMSLEDKMESFLLSETLKYLYLLFTPPKWKDGSSNTLASSSPFARSPLFSLDEGFVVNTEAHIVPVSSGLQKTFRECSREQKITPQMSKVLLEDEWTAHPKDAFENWFPESTVEEPMTASKQKKTRTATRRSAASEKEVEMSTEDDSSDAAAAASLQQSSTTTSIPNNLAPLFEGLSQPFSLNPDALLPHQRRQCPPLHIYMRDVAPHIDRLRSRELCHELVDTAVMANKYQFYGLPRETPQPRPVEIVMPDGTKTRISPAALQQMQEALANAGGGSATIPATSHHHRQHQQQQQQPPNDVLSIEVPADALNPLSNPLRLSLTVPQRLRSTADGAISKFGGVVSMPSFASLHMLYIATSETVAVLRFPHNGAQAGYLTGRAVFAPSLCYPRRSDRKSVSGPLVILSDNRLCDLQAEELAKRQIEAQLFGSSVSEAELAALKANKTAQSLRFGIMVRRGDCTFKEKVQRAQKVGARFVMVYNDRDGDGVLEMADAPSPLKDFVVAIPAVFISRKDGESLINYKTAQEMEQAKKKQASEKKMSKKQTEEGGAEQEQPQQQQDDEDSSVLPTTPISITATLRCAANVVDQFESIGIAVVESPQTRNVLLAPLRLKPVAEMLRDKASRNPTLPTVVPGARCDKPDCVLLLSYLMNDEGVPPWRVIKAAVNRAVSPKNVFASFAFQVGQPPPAAAAAAAVAAEDSKKIVARPSHFGINGLLLRTTDTVTVLGALGLSRSLTYVLKNPFVFSANAPNSNTQQSTHSKGILDGVVEDDGESEESATATTSPHSPVTPQLLRIEIVNLGTTAASIADEFDASESAIQTFLRDHQQAPEEQNHGVALRVVGEDPDKPGRMIVVTGFVSDRAAAAALVVPSADAEFTQLAVHLSRQRMIVKSEVVMDMRKRVGVFENF